MCGEDNSASFSQTLYELPNIFSCFRIHAIAWLVENYHIWWAYDEKELENNIHI